MVRQISCRAHASGVASARIKRSASDAAAPDAVLSNMHQTVLALAAAPREKGDLRVVVRRVVPTRRSVEPQVHHRARAAGRLCALRRRRICRDARDIVRHEKRVGTGREPARVPRLAGDGPRRVHAHRAKERARAPRIEGQAWRKLNQDGTERASQGRHVGEEIREQGSRPGELRLVRDRAWQLYRKTKRARHSGAPPLERGRPMPPPERAVDFQGAEHRGVARQAAPHRGKRRGNLARNRPPRGPHMNANSGHAGPWHPWRRCARRARAPHPTRMLRRDFGQFSGGARLAERGVHEQTPRRLA